MGEGWKRGRVDAWKSGKVAGSEIEWKDEGVRWKSGRVDERVDA